MPPAVDIESAVALTEETGLPVPGGFFHDLWSRYADTIAQQVSTAALGLVSGLLTPRLLGPQGRGELAAVTVWPITLIFLTSFGLERATVFFSGKYRQDSSAVASACIALGGIQTLLAMVIGFGVIPMALRHYETRAVRWALVFMLGAPIIRLDSLQDCLLIGGLKTRWYNLLVSICPASFALGVAILFWLNVPSVPLVVIIRLLGVTIAASLGFAVVRRELRPRWNWQWPVSKEVLKYGIRTNGGEISYFMNNRLDQLLMSMLLPSSALGIYLSAVALTETLCVIPRGIALVTLATGSNSTAAIALRWTKRSLLLTVIWIVPGAVALWVSSPFLISHLFGAAFSPALAPCRILILGSCALAFNTVLNEAARGMNHPEIPSYSELTALAVTAILLALLLKPFGPVGAAIASLAAYLTALSFTSMLLWSKYRTDLRARE